MADIEGKLQRLSDVIRGHLTPCADNAPGSCVTEPLNQEICPQPPSHANTSTSLVTGLEEPQDDDAAVNGMAMVFLEEHSSAFYGESSNINFTQLLLRAVASARNSAIEMPGTKRHAGSLNDGNVSSINHGQSQSDPPQSTEPSMTSCQKGQR